MKRRKFFRQYALPLYFFLAFFISWATIVLITGLRRFEGDLLPLTQQLMMMPAMLLGPLLAGVLMTSLADGPRGRAALMARLKHWRVGRWYGVLLFIPLLALGVLLAFSLLVSRRYLPAFAPLGLFYGLLAGFMEEIGWTGFATPKLLQKQPPLATALILGGLHGLWFLLAGFSTSQPGQQGLWVTDVLIFWVGGITAFRVIMTWVYVNTRSLLLGQLLRLVFTASLAAFIPSLPYPMHIPVYLVITMGLWAAAGVIIARYGKALTQEAVQTQQTA